MSKDKQSSCSYDSCACKAEVRTDSNKREWIFEELFNGKVSSYFPYYEYVGKVSRIKIVNFERLHVGASQKGFALVD